MAPRSQSPRPLPGALPEWPRSWISGYVVDVAALPVLATLWTVVYHRLADSAAPPAAAAPT